MILCKRCKKEEATSVEEIDGKRISICDRCDDELGISTNRHHNKKDHNGGSN